MGQRRAVIYVRISRDRADGDGRRRGLGVKRQREDCERLAAARGWDVVAVLTDNDVSAYSGKRRPGYERLLAMIETGDVDAVVAWHPDRLHRSPRELEGFIDAVEAHRVTVATVQAGDVDLESASGRMVARVVGAMARHESEQKGERLRRQREQAARSGRYQGGRRPFGYERDGVTVREDEAALVREAIERVLAGESLRGIAIDWNDQGLRSPSGAEWGVTTLRSMLTGPRLAGLRVHRGEVVGEAAWEPILSRDDHERVGAVLGNPRLHRRGRPPVALLSGILRCGKCGARMHSKVEYRSGRRRYVCPTGPDGSGGCGRVIISATQTEEIVAETVITALETPAIDRTLARGPRTKKRDDPTAEVAAVDARLAELADLFAAGDVTKAEWMRARAGLDERREKALRRVHDETTDAGVARVRARARTLRKEWPNLSTDEQRAVITTVIESIPIGPAQRTGKFDADRIGDPVWRA
jgi:DNA invertase Pin-like site-specific DNA recombinase